MSKVDVMAVARPTSEVLAWSRTATEPALRAAIERLPPSMRRIAGYHFGWWNESGRPTAVNGGKALRPALVMLAAEAVDGDTIAAVPAAVAVELVHNSSLLHDDVIDGDLTRRHKRTAWSVFGHRPAILAGDALLALAFDTLARSEHSHSQEGAQMLHAAFQDLLNGQDADISFEQRADVDLPEGIRMAQAKTGALLACACELGALAGGGGQAEIERMREFGALLGLAFQAVDDLLGIWGDPAVTGKPRYADLACRKKSLPVVAALRSGTSAGHDLATLYRRDEPLTAPELERAAGLIELTGGRDWCRRLADDLLAQALEALRPSDLAPRAHAELVALAEFVVRRDR